MSTNYGRRLIPQILDGLAAAEPDRIIYSVASFSNTTYDFRHVTAGTFAKAVDKTAWWLRNQTGDHHVRPSDPIQAIGYIGPRKLTRGLLISNPCPNGKKTTSDMF